MNIAHRMLDGYPNIDSAALCDAGHSDVQVMNDTIRPLHYTMKLAGIAYTVEQPGGSNFPTLQAIEKAPAGSVLVINAQGSSKSGHFGSIMASACRARGIVGVIIDGAVRDIPDLIQMNFPVFARGTMPRGNVIAEGILDQSIECGGVSVSSQDMIFADATGIVVFPISKAEFIYKKAAAITMNEVTIRQKISQGQGLLEIPEFAESDPARTLHHTQ